MRSGPPTSTTAPGSRCSAIAPAMSGSRRDKRCAALSVARGRLVRTWAGTEIAASDARAAGDAERPSGSACAQVMVRHRTHVGGRSRLSMRARPSTARPKKVPHSRRIRSILSVCARIERAAVREHEDERLPGIRGCLPGGGCAAPITATTSWMQHRALRAVEGDARAGCILTLARGDDIRRVLDVEECRRPATR